MGQIKLKTKIKKKSLSLRPAKMQMSLFVRTDLEKNSITSLAHHWILCSEWVPSEWESKHHDNPEVFHMTPVHQLIS